MMRMQKLLLASSAGSNFFRMFSSGDVVDEMIAYARTNSKVCLQQFASMNPMCPMCSKIRFTLHVE